ncbi:MAG: MFS transporter [Thermodesulfobacteriota bacterium]
MQELSKRAAAPKPERLRFVLQRFLIHGSHWLVFAHLPVILRGQGVADPRIGLVVGLFSLASMILMLPMGVMADRFSPRRTILSCAVVLSLYFLGLLVVRSLVPILGLVVAGGAAFAGLVVVSEALFLKLFGGEERGQRIASFQLATYLGYGLGPLAGGLLLGVSDQAGLLFAAAALGAILVFLVGLDMPDSPVRLPGFREYRRDLWQPAPLLLAACVFVIGTHFGVEQTSLSLFMVQELGLGPGTVGLVFAGLGLWMAAIVPVIGRLRDRPQAPFRFVLGGLVVSGLFQTATAWASGLASLLVIRILHTTGDAVALLELSVLTAQFFPSARLGGSSGLLYGVRTVATFAAALAAGGLNRWLGYGGSFLASGALVTFFAGLAVLVLALSDRARAAVGWQPAPPGPRPNSP